MKLKNLFWGAFFILAAIFVIATQTGSFLQIGILSVAATVLLAFILIYSAIHLQFIGIFVPIAVLYIIYTKPLGLYIMSPWVLILSAVLVSIAFYVIFYKSTSWARRHGSDYHNNVVENNDDNNPHVKVSFGGTSSYLHGNCLKTGHFQVSFGSLEVYFDEAELSPDGADIYLDCSFGAIALFIPRHWRVQDNISATAGGVENNKRLNRPEEGSPLLSLTGRVSLGGVEIKYI